MVEGAGFGVLVVEGRNVLLVCPISIFKVVVLGFELSAAAPCIVVDVLLDGIVVTDVVVLVVVLVVGCQPGFLLHCPKYRLNLRDQRTPSCPNEHEQGPPDCHTVPFGQATR